MLLYLGDHDCKNGCFFRMRYGSETGMVASTLAKNNVKLQFWHLKLNSCIRIYNLEMK
jgi:hypothetical protein